MARITGLFYFARFLPFALRRMILPAHILSEFRWQNPVARIRTAPRNKKSEPGREPTKKGRAEAPSQNLTLTLVLSTTANVNGSCKL